MAEDIKNALKNEMNPKIEEKDAPKESAELARERASLEQKDAGKMAFDFTTRCTNCGLCRTTCPAYNIMLDEAVSPRGKNILMKKNMLTNHLYLCTLCKACETFCTVPNVGIVDNIIRARAEMVRFGRETQAGKRMISNIRQHGNAVLPQESKVRGEKTEFYAC